ncbi:MAG: hypothetical protein ACHP79_03025 [Terriglobales bacterium]
MSSASSAITKRVTLEARGALARIILAHPPLNVIDFPMMTSLRTRSRSWKNTKKLRRLC